MCVVYGDGTVAESIVRMQFTSFKNRNFDLEDRDHSGSSKVVNDHQIQTLIKNSPDCQHETLRDSPHMSVLRYLKTLLYMNCCSIWVPDISQKKMNGLHFHLRYSVSKCNKNDDGR